MAITYSLANVTRLAEVNKIAENGRCLGFMLRRIWNEAGDRIETLWAVKGDVILTWSGRPTSDFNPLGRVWTRATEVPAEAEFIGSYLMPTRVKA